MRLWRKECGENKLSMGERSNELCEGCGKNTKYGDGEGIEKYELKNTKCCTWKERGRGAQHL